MNAVLSIMRLGRDIHNPMTPGRLRLVRILVPPRGGCCDRATRQMPPARIRVGWAKSGLELEATPGVLQVDPITLPWHHVVLESTRHGQVAPAVGIVVQIIVDKLLRAPARGRMGWLRRRRVAALGALAIHVHLWALAGETEQRERTRLHGSGS